MRAPRVARTGPPDPRRAGGGVSLPAILDPSPSWAGRRDCVIITVAPRARRLAEREFKNTFAPGVGGKAIGVDMVIAGLRHGTIKEASLPKEVYEAVDAELERLEREAITPARALILLLGAMGDIRGKTRLQVCAFLVDMGIHSKKTRDYFTMYGWEPSECGPYSSNLEYHVQKAIDGSLVEAFPAYAPEGKDSMGYRLTGAGEKRFQELLGTFENDTVLTRGILSRFKNDRTVDPLIAHAYREYPEYANRGTIRDRVKGVQ